MIVPRIPATAAADMRTVQTGLSSDPRLSMAVPDLSASRQAEHQKEIVVMFVMPPALS